jgi:sterol desaturase/sphingolipid hydroxylase (fatty acid hydroxylase superfamily)
MRQGKKTAYAHGEREHHRVYDSHGARAWQSVEDPKELFISFPLFAIAPIGLVFVAAYGWLRGWDHCPAFAAAMYACMVTDHQLHILFHKSPELPGVLGRLQRMHLIHHGTHRYNFFFVTGLVWDVLLGTARTKLAQAKAQGA